MRPSKIRIHCITLLLAALGVSCGNVAQAADRLQIIGETMGTKYAVTIDSPGKTETESALRQVLEARLSDINSQMSTWDDDSEISKFNRSESTAWISVSEEFATVVQEAARIHELTDGAFDPTVSPLIDLWGFGKPGRTEMPSQSAIDQALKSIGMNRIEVRLSPPALRKSVPSVQLNLSAIAKGYAVDALADLLTTTGRPSFVIDIGGETRAGLKKASGDAWKIGVESPEIGHGQNVAPQRIMAVTQMSIATSGDYRNAYVVDGVRYSHTIDPATGHPVRLPPASVSVMADSCMTADALATAMMVLGCERGTALAQQLEISVMFQTQQPDGTIVEDATGVFASGVSPAESVPPATESDSRVVFLAAAVLFLLAVGGMAIGVLVSRREIKGSCGGLASMPGNEGNSICELCTIPRDECVNEELRQQMRSSPQSCDDSADGSADSNPVATHDENAS
jgi:thiamine biosynthesis lipoprotein